MALTAIATANTTIGPAQYADMAQALAPRFLVDTPTDMQPSYSNGQVTIQPGAALVAGTRVRATGTNSVTIPTPASGSVVYSICLRVNWNNPASSAVELVAIGGNTINTTSSFDARKINRIPGVVYDAFICAVQRTAGSSNAPMWDLRMWGGDGGPIRVTQQGLGSANFLDARAGTMISTDNGQFTKRLDADGTWRDVGTPSNPWKLWTPAFRYYGKDAPDGRSGGNQVYLGTQGSYSGRYRVVDGLLEGFVQVTTGTGANFGSGPITMDLPLPCAGWQPDTWSMGHIYTDRSFGAPSSLDWHSEVLVKAGWTRGLLFAPVSGAYNDMKFHAATVDGRPGSGTPRIDNAPSTGAIYTYNLSYPVD